MTKRLRGLILTVTEQCNLRCDYCYVPVDRGRVMTDAIADHAIDWFLDRAADDGTIGLSFFGGEPFLALQQMRRSVQRLRDGLAPDRHVRVVTPTNGLAMSDADIAWCREHDIEIAISIDGVGDGHASVRRLADGRSGMSTIARKVPLILRKLPPGAATARMTVTPGNVGALCSGVRALAAMGFDRIVYIPDYDDCWDEPAIALWQREHERLAAWMIAGRSAGQRLPELPAWNAIAARLRQGTPRRRCGAGIEQVTVTPDGSLFPCYRFAYAKGSEQWRLGDVHSGIERTDRVGQLSAMHDRSDAERDACASCPAADGCTHFCPALGFIATGAIERVPETVCSLMTAQVASVRRLNAAASMIQSKPKRPWAKAAAVATAVSAMAACASNAGTSDATDAGAAGGDSAVQITLIPPDAGATIDADHIDSDHIDSDDAYVPVGGLCF